MQTYITHASAGNVTGYYHDITHGTRRLQVPDPAWVRPMLTVTLAPGESITVGDQVISNETDVDMIVPGVPDTQALAPLIDGGLNPDTLIPLDALEITADQYRDLIDHAGLRRVSVVAGVVQVEVVAPPAPTLAELKSIKITQLSADAQTAIYAGFESSALGSPHTYPAQNLDQQNLSASVLASLMPGLPVDWVTPFWCQDAAGVWDFRLHTAPQIQQAGQDGKGAILAALVKNKTLADQVMAAATAEQVEAVVW